MTVTKFLVPFVLVLGIILTLKLAGVFEARSPMEQPESPPVISLFSANPSSISSGGSSPLSWRVTGATIVSIDQGIGTVASSGIKIVHPSATTEYTLIARNENGSVSATVRIFVSQVLKPEPEKELPKSSFEAAEYANAEYGFSIRYPKDWGVQSGGGSTTVLYAAGPAVVPALMVDITSGDTFGTALTRALEGTGGLGVKINSESKTTLSDGTQASVARATWVIEGHPADSFSLGVIHDNRWIIITVFTVPLLAAYDEAKFSEIVHTLQFK